MRPIDQNHATLGRQRSFVCLSSSVIKDVRNKERSDMRNKEEPTNVVKFVPRPKKKKVAPELDPNPIKFLGLITPADFEYRNGIIFDKHLIKMMLGSIVLCFDLEVRTRKSGIKHFMARIPGKDGVDEVAELLVLPNGGIMRVFIDTSPREESDWIFTGRENEDEFFDFEN